MLEGAAESTGQHPRPFVRLHQPETARSDQPGFTGTRGRSSVLGTHLKTATQTESTRRVAGVHGDILCYPIAEDPLARRSQSTQTY